MRLSGLPAEVRCKAFLVFFHLSDFFIPADTSSKWKQKQSHLVSSAHCCQVSSAGLWSSCPPHPPQGLTPRSGLKPARSKPLRARADQPTDVPNQPENPAGKHIPRRACHHGARAQPPGNEWEPLQRALLTQPRPARTSSLSTPGCWAWPRKLHKEWGKVAGVPGKQKSVTWRSSAHLGTAHPFTPTQLPDSGHFRKQRGRKGARVRAGEEGSRLCPMLSPPPPAPRRSLPPTGRQMRMCADSCSSSQKALEVSLAADMTVQNH